MEGDNCTTEGVKVSYRSSSEENGSIYPPPTGNGYHHGEHDVSTDEDDVFDEDGLADHLSKPLMHPRQRTKVKVQRVNTRCTRVVWPAIYIFIFITSMTALVCLIIYIVNTYTNKLLLQQLGHRHHDNRSLVGCSEVAVEDVWTLGLPKLLTESAFRMVDVNGDNNLDIIFGFATGGDKLREEPLVCDIYFNGSHPCGGGILAVDGVKGTELWRTYTSHEVFGLNCNVDLDLDGTPDCIGGGRAGMFAAVSGHTGKLLWSYNDTEVVDDVMNVYTGQFVGDLNDDGVSDILNIHGGDPLGEPGSQTRLSGKIMFFSGRDGAVLRTIPVPDGKESYYSPVIYGRRDGTQIVLFGTGGETHAGSLYYITLDDLWKGQIEKARVLYTDGVKGIMTPPVLVDLTQDGIVDIVFSTFNSSVLAFNGDTFVKIWNYTFPSSETYATPAPGYYNDDDIPDFMVRMQYGPGFPMYYHSITTVLDGRTGQPIIQPFPKDSVGAQTSPLTVSAEGQGHDLFLYWIADCKDHEGQGGEFTFAKGTNIHEQTRSDFCRLRFKSEGFSRMLALGRNIELPGAVLYDSVTRKELERKAWVNTSAEAWRFLDAHPEHMARYQEMEAWNAARRMPTEQVQEYGNDYPNTREYSDYGAQSDLGIHASVGRKTGNLGMGSIHAGVGRKTGNGGGSYYGEDYNRNTAGYGNEYTGPVRKTGNIGSYNGDSYNTRIAGFGNEYGADAGYEYPQQYSNTHFGVGRKPGPSYTRDGYDNSNDYHDKRLGLTPPRRQGDRSVLSDYLGDPSGKSNKIYQQITDYMSHIMTPQVQAGGPVQRREDLLGRGGGSLQNDEQVQPHTRNGGTNFPANQGQSQVAASHNGDGMSQDQQIQSKIMKPKHKRYWSPRKKRSLDDNKLDTIFAESDFRSYNHKRQMEDKKVFFDKKSDGRHRQRSKRHVGPHDDGGLQRLISTGALAPPLLPRDHPAYPRTMDVVFATYWFYPAKTKSILPEDWACIEQRMKQEDIRFDPQSDFYGMDHDAFEHTVTDWCLEQSGHQLPEEGTYESQLTSNVYNLHMGQMTLYRLRLKCSCGNEGDLRRNNQRCAEFLPYEEQQWPAYMGSEGTSHWMPRQPDGR